MKTQPYGEYLSTTSYSFTPTRPNASWRKNVAIVDYIKNRLTDLGALGGYWNESNLEVIPGDGCWTSYTKSHDDNTPCHVIRYTEGLRDRAWMEEQDLFYLKKLQRGNPMKFRKELIDLECKNLTWYSQIIPKLDPNVLDDMGFSLLQGALLTQKWQVVLELLALPKIDKALSSSEGKTARDYGHEAGGFPFAVKENNELMFKVLVQLGADVNARDSAGQAALHHAPLDDELTLLRQLVELGADINTLNATGHSVLHEAVLAQNWQVALKLLALPKIDKALSSSEGKTARDYAQKAGGFPFAVKENNEPMFKALVQLGADVNAYDDDGLTALHYTALNAYANFTRQLIAHGADVFLEDSLNQTAWTLAKEAKHREVAHLLKQHETQQKKSASSQGSLSHSGSSGQPPTTPTPMSDLSGEMDYIPLADIETEEVLGQGGFGKVFHGNWKGTAVAVKEMPLTESGIKAFQKEAAMLSHLNHPKVVQFFGFNVSQERMRCSLVMELMVRGTLKDLLANNKEGLPWSLRLQIALDVVSGLVYLHGKSILHRDIKSENILLDGQLNAKLADFGLTRFKEGSAAHTRHQKAGTMAWMAPELLDEQDYTDKADVYSYGVVLWELASRERPYKDAKSDKQIMLRIMKGERDAVPADCPKEFGKVVEDCRAEEVEQRPSSQEVLTSLQGLKRLGIFNKAGTTREVSDDSVWETADFREISLSGTSKK